MPNDTAVAEADGQPRTNAISSSTNADKPVKNVNLNFNSVVPIITLKDPNLEPLVGNNVKSGAHGGGTSGNTGKDKKVPFGGFSFESESLPDFSEFEENTTSGESQDGHSAKNTSTSAARPSDGQMAPTTTIETVTISRPLKVIAFICGLFACLLLIMALAASEWLQADEYRQGLFVYCLSKTLLSNETVPLVDNSDLDLRTIGCHRLDLSIQGYTLIAAGFVVVSLLVNVFATLLTVLGLRCRDPNNKYKYYRIAVWVMAVALVAILVSLVLYPVCFAGIMAQSGRNYWEFGWAYGVAWGAAIFLFGGVILLLCDKESEEIYYKERTIVQYADTNTK